MKVRGRRIAYLRKGSSQGGMPRHCTSAGCFRFNHVAGHDLQPFFVTFQFADEEVTSVLLTLSLWLSAAAEILTKASFCPGRGWGTATWSCLITCRPSAPLSFWRVKAFIVANLTDKTKPHRNLNKNRNPILILYCKDALVSVIINKIITILSLRKPISCAGWRTRQTNYFLFFSSNSKDSKFSFIHSNPSWHAATILVEGCE